MRPWICLRESSSFLTRSPISVPHFIPYQRRSVGQELEGLLWLTYSYFSYGQKEIGIIVIVYRELEKIKVEGLDLYLPIAPTKLVRGIQLDSGIPLQSASKVPIMVTFDVVDRNEPNAFMPQACMFKVCLYTHSVLFCRVYMYLLFSHYCRLVTTAGKML